MSILKTSSREVLASNGLSKIGDYVSLGGALTGDTSISDPLNSIQLNIGTFTNPIGDFNKRTQYTSDSVNSILEYFQNTNNEYGFTGVGAGLASIGFGNNAQTTI